METYTARGRNAITRAVLEGNRLELSEDLAKALFHLPGLRGLHRRLLPLGARPRRRSGEIARCWPAEKLHPKPSWTSSARP
jgi:hypothetical protein